jgi:DivIVA domain-containing protein
MAQPAGTDHHRLLTAAELQAVTFHQTRRLAAGYNEDEVDEFIDRIAGAVQAMHDRITELEAEYSRLQEQAQANAAAAAELTAQHADLEEHIAHLTQVRNTTELEVRAFILSLIDHLDRIEGTE